MTTSTDRTADQAALIAGFDADLFLTTPQDMAPFARDWMGDHTGMPLAVARPRDAEELSALMVRCQALGIGVVPQGGLTGLVGAAVAETAPAELVIRLDRMNAIRSIDTVGFSMVVEAGCVLHTAKEAALAQDCLLPLTFGAEGTCQIGANVSTNAGGFNVLRYGMTRDLVLGLEVVLPDGRIWNGLHALRKDNRGYDLKQLFIGAEGTLGIVTAVALKLFPRPERVETGLVGLRSVADAMTLYAQMRRSCSDLLSAFEIILRPGLEVGIAGHPDLSDPLSSPCPVYVLMELASGGGVDLRGMLEDALGAAEAQVVDGVIATSGAQAEKLWLYRESMVEAQGRGGPYYRTDVSVPLASIPDFLDRVLARLEQEVPEGQSLAYGHVGDGNIHLNVIPPADWALDARKALFARAEAVIFAELDRLGGSISAEHGIGRTKKAAFQARVDPVTLDLMRTLKAALDPNHRLAPGRIFDPEA